MISNTRTAQIVQHVKHQRRNHSLLFYPKACQSELWICILGDLWLLHGVLKATMTCLPEASAHACNQEVVQSYSLPHAQWVYGKLQKLSCMLRKEIKAHYFISYPSGMSFLQMQRLEGISFKNHLRNLGMMLRIFKNGTRSGHALSTPRSDGYPLAMEKSCTKWVKLRKP